MLRRLYDFDSRISRQFNQLNVYALGPSNGRFPLSLIAFTPFLEVVAARGSKEKKQTHRTERHRLSTLAAFSALARRCTAHFTHRFPDRSSLRFCRIASAFL